MQNQVQQLGGKRKDQLEQAIYKTSFSGRDMTVNKQYARFQERFGPANFSQATEREDTMPSATENMNLASFSPEMMMESTGMQRSTTRASPVDASGTREFKIQQRIQNLSQSLGQLAANSIAKTEDQSKLPVAKTISLKDLVAKSASNSTLESNNRQKEATPASITVPPNNFNQDSGRNRQKHKLVDYLSPNAAQAPQVILPPTSGISKTSARDTTLVGMSGITKIRRRENARHLHSKLQQHWVPKLERVRIETFETLKHYETPILVSSNTGNDHALAKMYDSTESFGQQEAGSHNLQGQFINVMASVETAKFDQNLHISAKQTAHMPFSKSNYSASLKEKLSLIKKSAISTEEPELFKELRIVQQSKYDALELLPQLRSSLGDNISSNKPSNEIVQPISNDFELSPSDPDGSDNPYYKRSNDEIRMREEMHPTHLEFESIEQQPLSLDEVAMAAQLQKKELNADTLLSPMQSMRAGFSYPSEMKYSYIKEKDNRRLVSIQSSAPQMFTQMIDQAHSNYQFEEHELGDDPVSVPPTDYESHSQLIYGVSNDGQANLRVNQSEAEQSSHVYYNQILSNCKTENIFDRNETEGECEETVSATLAQHKSKQDDEGASGLGPMRLKFLHNSNEMTDVKKNAEEFDGTQNSAAQNQSLTNAAQLGLDSIRSIIQHGNGSATRSSVRSNKLQQVFQPLQSIFSAEKIAKATRVNQQVSDRISKIRAMQENFLRPPRESHSKSSVRSGRQMSDHDYERYTKELSQNIQLKKVRAESEDGASEQERLVTMSDLGDSSINQPLIESNPATIEYYGPNLSAQRPNRRQNFRALIQSETSADLDRIGLQLQQLLPFEPATTQLITQARSEDIQPCEDEKNNELRKLKMQNALLVLSNSFSKNATVAKQIYFSRWGYKVRSQRNILARLAYQMRKQEEKADQYAIMVMKETILAWKTFKDEKLQEEIAEEMIQVQLMQKNLLLSIQKQFMSKCKQRLVRHHLNIWSDRLRKLKAVREIKNQKQIQGCQRLERELRRQLRKRQRNFFKAVCQQPFVSELADEEVFSLMSGTVPSSMGPGTSRHYQRTSPMLAAGVDRDHLRSSSVQNFAIPTTPISAGPAASDLSNEEIVQAKLQQIKAAAKLQILSVKRLHGQGVAPTVRDLFTVWATCVRFAIRDDSVSQSFSDANSVIREAKEQFMVTQNITASIKQSKLILPLPLVQQQKQISGPEKLSQPIDEVYQDQPQFPESKVRTPEHEFCTDMLTMLDLARASEDSESRKLPQQAEKTVEGEKMVIEEPLIEEPQTDIKRRETIETTSDISSVNLDSDDSCFAATVEVIKLAPVKKNQEQILEASAISGKMPSTTNVSQIEPCEQLQESVSCVEDAKVEQQMQVHEYKPQNQQQQDHQDNKRDQAKLKRPQFSQKALIDKNIGAGTMVLAYTKKAPKNVVKKSRKSNILNSQVIDKKAISAYASLNLVDPFNKKNCETPQFYRSLNGTTKLQIPTAFEATGYYEMTKKTSFGTTKIKRVKSESKKQVQPQKVQLMQKLAKVAEQQIAAEVAMHEELQKEKTRQLTKDHERKTNLLFQKKNLRGMLNVRSSANTVGSSYRQNTRPSANSMKSQKVVTEQMSYLAKQQMSRNQLFKSSTQKSSFSTQKLIAAATPFSLNSGSGMMTPAAYRTRTASRALSKKSKKTTTTKQQEKVDIVACLSGQVRVKMPFGTIQNSVPILPQRTRAITTFSQMLAKGTIQQKRQIKRNNSGSVKVQKTLSKSSLHSINDRTLKNKYEPPVYKSRAFQDHIKNEDLGKSQPQVVFDEQNFSGLDAMYQAQQEQEPEVTTNLVFAAQAEQTQHNLRDLIRIDDIDDESNKELDEVDQLEQQFNQHMQMASLREAANQAGLEMLKQSAAPQNIEANDEEIAIANQRDYNFTLGKNLQLSTVVQDTTEENLRLTFGNEPDLTQQQLQSVQNGLDRLTNAIKPRIERYNVELFIYLIEALGEDSSDDGDELEQDQGQPVHLQPCHLTGYDELHE